MTHEKEIQTIIDHLRMFDLNISDKDVNYFVNALRHKTYENEHKIKGNYEMLEFVGDSLLQVMSARFIYENLKYTEPGKASMMRVKLVNTENLAQVSRTLGLNKIFLKSNGAIDLENNEKIQADLFEALCAAIYYAFGEKKLIDFLIKYLFSEVKDRKISELKDPKSLFQEYVQAFSNSKPEYRTVETKDKLFETSLYFEGKLYGQGIAKNKKESKMHAAQSALEKMGQNK
ncbi:RNAse III [Mycoplasma testudineum]|uniref:Ribonuclease 3 n=1 Tax=Mycoplasma testudineum TaxID=244584 RepID=A0A4R6ID26_9MOLU|nr:ribonuclease III [Mycoplasma testudineum]OYD26596.1 ribonuclease III [Mycoplasma testudineum]TDO19428.1 RNAse III [Mycoplasma testudineum]